ncbi:MAG: hypothetical protein LH618_08540 [Saprospiraceae bacterium]|nr:hypothetical protein [Saprospiraceae bacterium]
MIAKLDFEQTLSPIPAVFQFHPVPSFAIATSEGLSTTGSWPADAGQDRLIQRDQDLNIGLQWTVSGALCTLFTGCTWKIDVYVERWGAGETNVVIPAGLLTAAANTATLQSYTKVVTIPASTLVDGIYDMVCVLRLFNPAGNPLPVAAFGEFGKFTVFTAVL